MMKNVVLVVTGSRHHQDKDLIHKHLDQALLTAKLRDGALILLEGGAQGADRIAQDWAKANSVAHVCVKPDWQKYGKAAGMIRNQAMVDKAVNLAKEYDSDFLFGLAFPLKESKGTWDCIRRMNKARFTVRIVKPEEEEAARRTARRSRCPAPAARTARPRPTRGRKRGSLRSRTALTVS